MGVFKVLSYPYRTEVGLVSFNKLNKKVRIMFAKAARIQWIFCK